MVRALADHQVDRFSAVMQWPVAEALAAYEALLRRDAQQAYSVAYLAWIIAAAAGSKAKCPRRPAILEG